MDESPSLLGLAIMALLAEADHDMTPEEIAEELARRALEARSGAWVGNVLKRGH